MRILTKCEGCKRWSWYIKKRKVLTPTNVPITSKFLLCNRCATAIETMLNNVTKDGAE